MRRRIAPLKSSLLLVAIIGFFIAWFVLTPTAPDLAISIMIICIIIVIASFISMTYGPVVDYDARRNKHAGEHFRPVTRPGAGTQSPSEQMPAPKMVVTRKIKKKSTAKKAPARPAKKKVTRKVKKSKR